MERFPTLTRDSEEKVSFSNFGKVYSYTVVQNAPEAFESQTPYVLAIVQLDDGPKVTAQLTDLDSEPQIGDRVEMVTRKLFTDGDRGIIIYGYKFRRVLRESKT